MMRFLVSAIVMLAVAVSVARAGPASVAGPALVALNRCNGQTINDSARHLLEYERRPASGGSTQLLQRYGLLADLAMALGEEREILDSVCTDQTQRDALFAQIGALSAWALALESDVSPKLNASCAAAAKGLPTMMLADAWLALADVVNDQGGKVPSSVANVEPKVRTRAVALGLELPSWRNTSAYWRDQVQTKAKAEIATCPSQSPSAAPTSTKS
ncbi:MAG: hypothetical protein JO351_07380 [Candidatus Eremiobacteraeota bacterium]|nr:hypothetical protein [Candidatus Eremiobacteraeota bacterium]MBV9056446.1 hypothetical protein [Candidatus Eremiobacteraeota bacterium]